MPDFVSGAMENWGLITFRETRILTTPEDSVSDKEGTANTVAHELAHMWFGDLGMTASLINFLVFHFMVLTFFVGFTLKYTYIPYSSF